MFEFQDTNDPEVLEKLLQVSDDLVFDEKAKLNLKHEAFQRINELEEMVTLPPVLKYRKAVLLLFLLWSKEDSAVRSLTYINRFIKNDYCLQNSKKISFSSLRSDFVKISYHPMALILTIHV